MPNYKYRAMNEKGEKIEGSYAADSKEAVMEMIRVNDYYPLFIEEESESINVNLSLFEKVKTKDIAIFCRQFYTMLDAGAPINTCLHVLSEQLTCKKLKEALIKVNNEIRKGSTLSEAMKEQPEVFPDLLNSMVAAGEQTGNLDTIMLRMANHYEKENKINRKIKGAMIYPCILIAVAIAVITGILTFIMPMFVSMFKDSDTKLPAMTRVLLDISNGIKYNFLWIIIIIILIIYVIRIFFKSENGINFSHSLRLKLPIIKGLNEKIIVSRFTRTLSTVLSSGITLVEGLNIVSEVMGNRIAEEKIVSARDKVIKGYGLAESIKETNLFPPMLVSMVAIGQESGSLEEILSKTADFYDDELEAQIEVATSLLEPIMILVMGVIIGIMIISIVLPMFKMYNTVK